MEKISLRVVANKIKKFSLESDPIGVYKAFYNMSFLYCYSNYRNEGKLSVSKETSSKLQYLFDVGCFLSDLKQNKFSEKTCVDENKETISFLVSTKDFLLTKNVVTNKFFQKKFQEFKKDFSKKEKSFVKYWEKK